MSATLVSGAARDEALAATCRFLNPIGLLGTAALVARPAVTSVISIFHGGPGIAWPAALQAWGLVLLLGSNVAVVALLLRALGAPTQGLRRLPRIRLRSCSVLRFWLSHRTDDLRIAGYVQSRASSGSSPDNAPGLRNGVRLGVWYARPREGGLFAIGDGWQALTNAGAQSRTASQTSRRALPLRWPRARSLPYAQRRRRRTE